MASTISCDLVSPDNKARLTEARDRLVLEHLWVVHCMAARLSKTVPKHVCIDDLFQAGVIGLLDAADKFSPSKNVSFRDYASWRIRGSILDYLRGLDWASRDLRRRYKQIGLVRDALAAKLQRPPFESEIAEEMKLSIAATRLAMIEMAYIQLSASHRPDADFSDPDFEDPIKYRPDRMCERGELTGVLNAARDHLSAREGMAVRLYYDCELTMTRVAALMGINESRVSQILKHARKHMNEFLAKAGIHSMREIVSDAA
jgi:RNA polymerase sigma factor for flagellar operon FliA